MTNASRQAASAAAFFVAMTLVTPAPAAPTLAWTVDCTRGHSISRALEHAPPGMKLLLNVRGTCNESVLIDRDDVTLQGDAAWGGVLNAPPPPAIAIQVRAARVVIDRLAVNGGWIGIDVYGVFDTTITNTVIQDAANWGITVKNGHAFVSGSTVEHSGGHGIFLQRGSVRLRDSQVRFNGGAGIHLQMAAGLNASGSPITSNGSNGIELDSGSEATIDGNTITGNGTNSSVPGNGVSVLFSNATVKANDISNNRQSGVATVGSTLGAWNNTVTGNGDGGVQAHHGSTLALGGGTIARNTGNGVRLNTNSTGSISGAAIQSNTGDGIWMLFSSRLRLEEPATTVGGNVGFGLRCSDGESSVISVSRLNFSPPNGHGGVSPGCTVVPCEGGGGVGCTVAH